MVSFNELERAEIDEILSRNHVGRIGYIGDNRVEILPINYVYANGWIYGRTSGREKVQHLRPHWWVAFEVDEVDGLFDWRSVVVHGGFYPMEESGPPDARERRAEALEALRRLLPETFLADDPVPFRTIVFGIAVQEVTGRSATSKKP
jgi:nitroimidazol reductase NimA-like FMN-containing flavoprotein (pyridoxamine 5'-phosphate oxidase superfamily)